MGLMVAGFVLGIKHGTIIDIARFDLIVSVLILVDFVIFRIRKEKLDGSVWQFIKENWIYIVSIIPVAFISFNIFQLYGYFFILWLILFIKFYALIKVLQITGKRVRSYPSKTKLDYATVVLLLALIIGSFLFYIVETGVNPEVPNYESAMWFAIVSMATVGYGDIVPVTGTGRIIAVLLILTGIGYLSLVTATLAYSFIDLFREESSKAMNKVQERVIKYEDKIDELIDKVDNLDQKIDETNKKKD
jgi:voltage-gated potassium channel